MKIYTCVFSVLVVLSFGARNLISPEEFDIQSVYNIRYKTNPAFDKIIDEILEKDQHRLSNSELTILRSYVEGAMLSDDYKGDFHRPVVLKKVFSENDIDLILSELDTMTQEFFDERKKRMTFRFPSDINDELRKKLRHFSDEILTSIFEIYPNSENEMIIPNSLSEFGVYKYLAGGKLEPHYDTLFGPPLTPAPRSGRGNNNKEIKWTAVIYLNDDYEGGELYFPHIDFTFKGQKGDVLIFQTLTDDNKIIHPYSLHYAKDVTKGTKIVSIDFIKIRERTDPYRNENQDDIDSGEPLLLS